MTMRPTRHQIEAGLHGMDPRISPEVADDLGLTTPDNFDSHVQSGAQVGMLGVTGAAELVVPPERNSKDGVGYLSRADVAQRFAAAWYDSQKRIRS